MNKVPSRSGATGTNGDRLTRNFIICFAVVEAIGLLLLVIHVLTRN